MRCPVCRKEVAAEGNPFRPFCSERCKLIDLDHWLSGRYRISTPLSNAEEAEEDAGDAASASEETRG
jgi:uncharacterized protein